MGSINSLRCQVDAGAKMLNELGQPVNMAGIL